MGFSEIPAGVAYPCMQILADNAAPEPSKRQGQRRNRFHQQDDSDGTDEIQIEWPRGREIFAGRIAVAEWQRSTGMAEGPGLGSSGLSDAALE
jgi:hypothetical protein